MESTHPEQHKEQEPQTHEAHHQQASETTQTQEVKPQEAQGKQEESKSQPQDQATTKTSKPEQKEEKKEKKEASKVPETMKAAYLEEPGKAPIIKEVPVPKPGSGEVLIKVEASPINPSDLAFLAGSTYAKLNLPTATGFEGAGTVISSGGGLVAFTMVGKRVAFAPSPDKGPGAWAEYAVTDAQLCIPIDQKVPSEQAACALVNPFTAIGFLDVIKTGKHKAIVQTAANSQLGRMIIKLMKREKIKTINIVRKDEQIQGLRDIGADVVLNQESATFEEDLKSIAGELNATCLLECICGPKTHKVIKALPKDSVVYVYGKLENAKLTEVDLADILINNKTIKPFFLPNWMNTLNIISKLGVVMKMKSLLETDLKSEIAKTFPLENIAEALSYYKENMSGGKIIIKPGQNVEKN